MATTSPKDIASPSEPKAGAISRLWLSIKRRATQPLLLRVCSAAVVALALTILSHQVNVRVHGANGDLVVFVPALAAAYLLWGRLSVPPYRHRFEWLASLWLQVRQRSPAIIDGIATVIFTVGLVALLHAMHVHVAGPDGEAVIAISAFIVSYLVVSQITNLMVGTLVRKIHSIGAAAHGAARPTILSFVDLHLERLDHQVEAMLSRSGALLEVEEVKFWTEQCFAFGKGSYDGTDSHVPSDFIRLYPSYLEAHGKMLDAHPEAPENARILIGPHRAFRDDYIEHYEMGYSKFLDWHGEKVKLLHLERERAEHFRKIIGDERTDREPLPTVDLGIWHGQYAVLFREEVEDGVAKIRLWMVFPGDDWYAQCEALIEHMKDGKSNGRTHPAARPLATAVPEIFERNLCRHWEKFVDPAKRMEKLGPFFTHLLDKQKTGSSILDAAAGIGSDALWLVEHGFNVTLNEIEPVYRDIIEDRFRAQDRPLLLFAEDWRKLPEKMGQWFTTVLVLGNSLCLLSSTAQQRQALKAFYDVLAPGGALMIDERNFTHFTAPDVAERIERNPIRNFPYKGEVMYCGNGVKGCPKRIDRDDVVFRYYRNDESFHQAMMMTDDLGEQQRRELDERELGVLHLYPFRRNELGNLLVDCNFEDIQVYRDLDWQSPYPFVENGEWFDQSADFFVYVATKPGAS